MQLYAHLDGEPIAAAYGAYMHNGRLRCPLLFVKYGNKETEMLLKNEEFSAVVKLPRETVCAESHTRVDYAELEVVRVSAE